MASMEGSRLELKESVSECDFCTEACPDCKLLPCLHVCCKKCLEDSRMASNPRDVLICPVCGQEFQIPGCEDLQEPRQGIVNQANMPKHHNKSKDSTVSDVSSESGGQNERSLLNTGKCPACADGSCEGCRRQLDMQENFPTAKEQSLQPVGGIKYCPDCKEILCVPSLSASDHRVSDVVRAARSSLESSIGKVSCCESDATKKLEALDSERTEFHLKVESLKSDINKARDELKKLVDVHADSLVSEVDSWKEEMTKTTNERTEDLTSYINSLDRYKNKFQEVLAKGSANDICRTSAYITQRNEELLRSQNARIEHDIYTLRVFLKKTKIEDLLPAYEDNIVGILKDEEIPDFERIDNTSSSEKANDKTETWNSQMYRNAFPRDGVAYKEAPILVRTLRTKSGQEDDRGILGLTILDDELFVVSRDSSEVEVFDCRRLIFSCELEIDCLFKPEDIASCSRLKCLYIMNRKTTRSGNQIIRVDANGKLIRKWSTDQDWGRISVTPQSNVLLSVYKSNRLMEYTPKGQLVRVMDFSIENFDHPRHAIKLTSGEYIVSHGEIGDVVNRVLKVDANGNIVKSFSGSFNSQMKRPFSLESDHEQSILVADADNGRVLLLSSELQYKRELLSSEKYGIRYPVRMCFNKSKGQLFLADNQVENKRISVFLI